MASVNVQVAVRCRPFVDKERQAKSCVRFNGKQVTVRDPRNGQEHTNSFDSCFDMGVTQQQLYTETGARLLERVLEGYNGTVLAYGQSGSGKSYTIFGNDGQPGILQRSADDMFRRIRDASHTKRYLVTVSFVEFFAEHVRDLLNPSDKNLQVRQHPQYGVYVDDLSEIVVKNEEDVRKLAAQAMRIRQLGSSGGVFDPSFSHVVASFKIEQRDSADAQRRSIHSKLLFCDLAGADRQENPATRSINSLHAVISALSSEGGRRGGGHVPYRESKITRLLQDSLGGNSLTVTLICLSPADSNVDESINAVRVATQTARISNTTRKNEDENARIIRELRDEIDRLRTSLSEQSPTEEVDSEKMAQMEQLLRDLDLAKRQTWEEREKQSRMYEEDRRNNLVRQGIFDLVMESASVTSDGKHGQEKLQMLQRERLALVKNYREERAKFKALQRSLQDESTQFTKFSTEGKLSDSDRQARLRRIEIKKQQVKDLDEKVGGIAGAIKENIDRHVQEASDSNHKSSDDNMNVWKAYQEDTRMRMQEDNERTIGLERKRLDEESEKERSRVKADVSKKKGVSLEEYMNLEERSIQERKDKNLLISKFQLAEREKELLWSQIEENDIRHQHELQNQQIQDFKVFRAYREQFEEEKKKMEASYRKLLESAVNDLVFLTTRSDELELELRQYRPKQSWAQGEKPNNPGWRY